MNIRFTKHALRQCEERGASREEVIEAIKNGLRESAKHGRFICKSNFQFNGYWQEKFYTIKQVAPIIVEENDETVVITVYTFYF